MSGTDEGFDKRALAACHQFHRAAREPANRQSDQKFKRGERNRPRLYLSFTMKKQSCCWCGCKDRAVLAVPHRDGRNAAGPLMKQSMAESEPEIRTVSSSLMLKVFCAFARSPLLSAAISVGGKWFGRSIAMAGHTDDATLHEIVIGNDVITVPANAIRFERARRDGIASRLDLYLRWPEMNGYSTATRDDFNHAGGSRRIIFLSFEERMMSRDMSGRFGPIYSSMIVKPGVPGPGGRHALRLH